MVQNIFKLVLLGEGAVGKTSIKRNYMGKEFVDGYKMTIGATFAVKKLKVDFYDVTLQLWDLAGQPRFDVVREAYYRGTKGALLVFDVTRPETYEILPKWLLELTKNNEGKKVPVILVGNKADLRENCSNCVPYDYAKEYSEELSKWLGFYVPYIETSAKTGQNIEDAFTNLTKIVIQNAEKMQVELELI